MTVSLAQTLTKIIKNKLQFRKNVILFGCCEVYKKLFFNRKNNNLGKVLIDLAENC